MNLVDNDIFGYEPNIFVKKPSDNFTCPLCLNILRDPRQCPNGHCFCHGCVESWVTKRNQCPLCQVEINLEKMVRCLVIKAVIDEKETFCPTCDSLPNKNSVECCLWIGELHTRYKHAKTDCGFAIVECPSVGCGMNIERKNVDHHLRTECEFNVRHLPVILEHTPNEIIFETVPVLEPQTLVQVVDSSYILPIKVIDEQITITIIEQSSNNNSVKSTKVKKPKHNQPTSTDVEPHQEVKVFSTPQQQMDFDQMTIAMHNLEVLGVDSDFSTEATRNTLIKWVQGDCYSAHSVQLLLSDLSRGSTRADIHSKFIIIAHEFNWKEIRNLQPHQGIFSPVTIFQEGYNKGVEVCILIRKHELGYHIACKFGENGKDYAHRLSVDYTVYSPFSNVNSIRNDDMTTIRELSTSEYSENELSRCVKCKLLRVFMAINVE